MKNAARRILVIGWPKAGKTTFAKSLAEREGLKHYCTDHQSKCPEGVTGVPDGLEWSEVSQYVADHWLGKPGVIEGVAIPRALRKWRAAHPKEPAPADKVIVLTHRAASLTTQQAAMGKGVDTVFSELWGWLGNKVETIAR